MSLLRSIISLGVGFAILSGCSEGSGSLESEKHDLIDPKRGLSRGDYRDFYNQEPVLDAQGKPLAPSTSGNTQEPPIPELQDIIVSPTPPEVGETQLVSVAVTDDVPLKDVLIELARLADVDVEIDAGVTGGITLRAKDRPFNEVVSRIADLAGLRYTYKNNVLRIERDLPYVEEYSLNLLNIERTSNNSINVNTASGSSGSGSSDSGSTSSSSSDSGNSEGVSGGTTSGSSSTISGVSVSDFWRQFEESVKKILAYQPPSFVSSSALTIQTAPISNNRANSLLRSDALLNADMPAVTAGAPSQGAADSSDDSVNSSGDVFYVINRQAGTMTVSATERHHRMIERFIKRIERNSSAQVLIEAKIVEVSLNEQYKTGINWTKFGNTNFSFSRLAFEGVLPPNSAVSSTQFPTDNSAVISVLPSNVDLNFIASLTETFGTTRTISSPRLHATNNQQAVLSFAENQPYFTLEITTTPGTTGTTTTPSVTTVNSTLNTVPVGLILSLQPSVNLDTNEVTLNVRPTLSSVVGNVADPAATIAAAQSCAGYVGTCPAAGLVSNIPIIQVREVDSIMKIKSGEVMVIGGLMEGKNFNTDTGVPGVSSVPIVGNAFKAANKYNTITELVIFIRATIVPSSGSADNADKLIYDKFINDPRPLKFR